MLGYVFTQELDDAFKERGTAGYPVRFIDKYGDVFKAVEVVSDHENMRTFVHIEPVEEDIW